jgi:7-keto-8-aminopelargonate synthetase-like enzyme
MPRLPITTSRSVQVEIEGRSLLYFGGCDYLGLAHDPRVMAALAEGTQRHGVSAGASRETSGNRVIHELLEAELAIRLGCEAALLVPEGALANLAAVQGLVAEFPGRFERALIDELAHPSLADAARGAGLACESFTHLDCAELNRRLSAAPRALVLTDSVFPSRGELAPVADLLDAIETADTCLVLDECHATGIVGPLGRGMIEQLGARNARVLITSTLAKALGTYGGFVAGPAARIALVRSRSSAYVGTTPIPPALAEAALAAVRAALPPPGAREPGALLRRLRGNVQTSSAGLERLGLSVPRVGLPVFSLELAPAARMEALHAALMADGLFVPLMRYYGGPAAGSLRMVVTAAHTSADIERLLAALARHL